MAIRTDSGAALVAEVVVDPKAGGLESVWTYRVPEDVVEGDALFIPLGNRAVIGYATRVYEVNEGALGFPIGRLKSIYDKVEGLNLPRPLLQLVDHVAQEYVSPFSIAIAAAAPSGVRDQLATEWRLTGGESSLHLTPLQEELLRTLRDSGGAILQKSGGKMASSSLRGFKLLRAKGLVEQRLRLKASERRKGPSELLSLSSDAEKIEQFLKREAKKKPAQALTIMRIQTGEPRPLSGQEVMALSGVTETTLRAMVESGLLERIEPSSVVPKAPPEPNVFQRRAIEMISGAVRDSRFKPFLLYGVTGSGKTEVYLRCAAEALRLGKQVLYLVPEIALAAQTIGLLRERFGDSVALVHSDLPARDRLENWNRIRGGDRSIVLGARSALFSPLTNLGLIVVDEEHETSYKQESAPRYHARDLALFLGREHGAAVVLGSATPSVESFEAAKDGRYELLNLPQRAAEATLPSVEVVDLTEGYKAGHPSMLSDELRERLESTLGRDEQAILFLNRRAYAPFLICRDCGHQFKCPQCAVSLAYSRSDRRLRCHHCGYWTLPPDVCPECEGHRLSPFGAGTEKVEEAVKMTFPSASVARLDRDVARKRGALEEILTRFRGGETQVLVGTQMVAKGLDFPNVTLVGVIAADISLNIPDFRSAERTFQLLSQVAGRAGRARKPGHVVIQTFNPGHVAVASAQAHDYEGFFDATRQERFEAMYPPFVRLVNVVISGAGFEDVLRVASEAGKRLQELEDSIVLGPTECAIERLQGRWRRHLLVKLPPDSPPHAVGSRVEGLQTKTVSVVVDVDPYSLV